MPTDILQLNPLALVVLFAAGGGVIYVVRIFTQAQTVREREMWAAIQSLLGDVKEINGLWLETVKAQGDKSSDAILNLSNEIAAHTVQMTELTAAVNNSIETGASLKGASSLMFDILRGGDGHKGVKHEAER
jgi:hypothetical protein